MSESLPPTPRSAYLIEFAGWIGFSDLSWQSIHAFSSASGYQLAGWECEVLILIGRAYTASYRQFDGNPSPPPWRDLSKIDRVVIAEQVRAALRR